MVIAGIDVAHKTLALVIRREERSGKPRSFANTAEGHAALVKVLRKSNVTRVCLEATGQYHLDLSLALDAAGFELMVLNPKAAKRFAEAMLTHNKTDALDAEVLAQFAQRMPFAPWQRPDPQALAVRACARRLEALSSMRTQSKNQLHAARLSTTTPQCILDDLALSIAQLDAQITHLREQAKILIHHDERLHIAFELLLSLKGIAEASAIQIIGEILILPEDMNAKQWVAMAGLDPRTFTSGTSVAKKPRLSKTGNRYLRMALYMPALSASRHELHVRSYYRHLIETRGLKKIQAVCAVMRKLLHAIHAMLRTQQPFDGSRFCNIEATSSP
jgi:transposase